MPNTSVQAELQMPSSSGAFEAVGGESPVSGGGASEPETEEKSEATE